MQGVVQRGVQGAVRAGVRDNLPGRRMYVEYVAFCKLSVE